MPEIKHNFTAGKMNKDLDERLVQNGEYRHAENVQVSTSDGSDIGAIQNVLGNSLVNELTYLPQITTCIATIADEKNDKIYWFVKGNSVVGAGLDNGDLEDSNGFVTYTQEDFNSVGLGGLITDDAFLIMADGTGITYVQNVTNPQTDHGITIVNGVAVRDNTNNGTNSSLRQNVDIVSGVEYTVSYKRKYVSGNSTTNIFIDFGNGNQGIAGSNETSGSYVTVEDTFTATTTGTMEFRMYFIGDMEGEIDDITITTTQQAGRILEYDKVGAQINPVFIDIDNSVLKFGDNIITGINIIDNFLFWTDSVNEPKKINIDRCKEGTIDALTNTKLVVNDTITADDVTEANITVIKTPPKKQLTVTNNYFRDPSLTHSAVITTSDSMGFPHSLLSSSNGSLFDFSLIKPGDYFSTIIESDIDGGDEFQLSWEPGTKVVLKEFSSNGTAPTVPLQSYAIKGFITDWEYNEFSNTVLDLADFTTQVLGVGWSETSSNNFGFDAASGASQKLIIATWDGNSGQKIKSFRKYRVSFNLDEFDEGGGTALLQGKLICRLFNNQINDSGPPVTVTQAFKFAEFDDLAAGDAGFKSFEIIDNENVTSVFNDADAGGQDYANNVVFESRAATTGGAVFQGSISNVKIERIDNDLAKVQIEVTSVDGTPKTATDNGASQLDYVIDLFDEEEGLFENKLPRFSYRYKYEDGEYSSFGPFTPVTFAPGNFRYNSVNGFNQGMTNIIKNVTLGGDATKSIFYNAPNDVVSIDILYKEEGSPVVYIVDTLKNNENTYAIKKETINGIVPENQLLRPWDNVPKSALSQEVVGNRIVYGNYKQNYDLIDSSNSLPYNLGLDVNVKSTSNNTSSGIPSIKSSREYQVGVVYTDKYGRETPVITNSDSTVRLDKLQAPEINEFVVRLTSDGHPVNMDYFKFFVKDTGGEYYNMAMDRYYDAEDGNVWLSFPSVDRSKIDIDDTIILKKGIGSNALIQNQAKYKVVDIKNEAPDHIKKNEALVSKKRHSAATPVFVDIPVDGGKTFSVDKARYSASVLQNIPVIFNEKKTGEEYYISLSNINTGRVSKRYKIINLEKPTGGNEWAFSIETSFTDVAQFSDDPDNNNGGATLIVNNTYFSIYKTTIENSPKFDGRFFVKIYEDSTFKLIDDKVDDVNTEYVVPSGASKTLYYYKDAGVGSLQNTPAYHGTHDATDLWGMSQGTDLDYTMCDDSGLGNFILGKTTLYNTLANLSTQLGNLDDFFNARSQVSRNVGDWDAQYYPGGTGYTNYNEKHPFRNQMAWKAYFRGINTEVDKEYTVGTSADTHGRVDKIDQAKLGSTDDVLFEDVWFINESKVSINFDNDNAWEVSDQYPTLAGNVQNTEWAAESGGWEQQTNTSALEISFGGIEPNTWPTDPNARAANAIVSDPSFFDLEDSNLNYTDQRTFISKLAVGSQFRFKEDPTNTIYTINDVNKYYRIAYDNIQEEAATNASQYAGQVNARAGDFASTDPYFDIRWPDDTSGDQDYRSSTFLDACNFFISYKLQLNKEIVWNPVEGHNTPITGGSSIVLESTTANPVADKTLGEATIVVDSIVGTDSASGEIRAIVPGMVLDSYFDFSASITRTLTIKPIVSKIDYDDGLGEYTIFLKSYNGIVDDLEDGTADGAIEAIATADNLIFKQYGMNGMSPNSAKNLNYFRQGGGSASFDKTGVQALGYTIEIVEAVSSDSEENLLPENPAIWETQPKKDKDLDVYYEASQAYPIKSNPANLQNLIPVGSIIEHTNSNAVPAGTTVTGVDANGQITLSNDVQIDRPSAPTHQTELFFKN